MRYEDEKVVALAKEGAKKYAADELETLKKFAAIDCGSRNVEGNAKVVEIVDAMLGEIEGIDIQHHFFEGFGINIVARLKPENPDGKIILNAHLDTVFKPGDVAKYPFHIDENDPDVAYGLGIIDCKGGVVTACRAVKIAQEAGMLPNKEIVFIFNCDEEIGSPTGKQVFEPELAGTDAAYVFEPARLENGILTARKGSGTIVLDVKGTKAHSGVNYTDGRSALLETSFQLLELYKKNLDDRGIQFNAGPIVNEDPANVVSGHVTTNISVRVANKADMETVEKIIAEMNAGPKFFADGTEVNFEIKGFSVPMERTDANVALFKQVAAVNKKVHGFDMIEQATGGGSDANYFNFMGVPSIDALGPYMYKIHSVDEHMKISSIEEKTALFAAVLGMMD